MAMENPQTFRDLLRRYRIAAGLTQEELAEAAGLSSKGISDLERGARTMPHRDTVLSLAQALRLSEVERSQLLATARRRRPLSPVETNHTPPNDLPVQLTSFVGRQREIAEVKKLLGATRLLTLTGTGGRARHVWRLRLLRTCWRTLRTAYTSSPWRP